MELSNWIAENPVGAIINLMTAIGTLAMAATSYVAIRRQKIAFEEGLRPRIAYDGSDITAIDNAAFNVSYKLIGIIDGKIQPLCEWRRASYLRANEILSLPENLKNYCGAHITLMLVSYESKTRNKYVQAWEGISGRDGTVQQNISIQNKLGVFPYTEHLPVLSDQRKALIHFFKTGEATFNGPLGA